jgi:hypothetical protein
MSITQAINGLAIFGVLFNFVDIAINMQWQDSKAKN